MLSHLPGFQRSMRVFEGRNEKTILAYSQKLAEFAAWCEGNDIPTDPAGIERKHVEAYLEWCYYRGNGNQTRYTKLIALAKYFRYLMYDRIVGSDPTAEIPRPSIAARLMATFNHDEVLRFFRQCDPSTEKGLRDICILILAAFCGLRMDEIIMLNISSILDDGKDIDIHVIGKRGSQRMVWLWKAPGAFVRQYLLARIGQGARSADPFLSSYRKGKATGRRLTSAPVDQLIKKLGKAAGIRKAEVHLHMFRATHANDLQHVRGYTLRNIMERLGWTNMATAGRYLVRRERIHRVYNNLHEYWRDFTKIYIVKEDANAHDDDGIQGDPGLAQ